MTSKVSGYYTNWASSSASNFSNANNTKADDASYGSFDSNGGYLDVSTFAIYLPTDTLNGIEVVLHIWSPNTNSSDSVDIYLSWDNGSTWTAAKTAPSSGGIPTSETTYLLGGASDLWGRSWTLAELSPTTFRLKAVYNNGGAARTCRMDYMAIRFYYQGGEFEQKILATADDGREKSSTWATNILEFGYHTSALIGGLRFTNITIPKGYIIDEAKLVVCPNSSNSGSSAYTTIKGVDEDDFAGFDSTNKPSVVTKTTASVDWTIGDILQDVSVMSTDIKTIVQEIVNRDNWVSGNDIAFTIERKTGTWYKSFYDYDASSVKTAYLAIMYTPAVSGSDAITFTESLVTHSDFKKGLSDDLSISELQIVSKIIPKTDTISFSESINKNVGLPFSDTQSFSETITNYRLGFFVILSDSIPLSEAVGNKNASGLSDSILIEEDLVFLKAFERSLDDLISNVEALNFVVKQAISDTIDISESGPVKVFNTNITDSQTLAEESIRGLNKTETDNISFTDSLFMVGVLSLSDSLNIVEVSVRSFTCILVDALSISENLANSYSERTSDSVLMTESLTTANSYVRELSDSQNITESQVFNVNLQPSDSISFSEEVSGKTFFALYDSLNLAENLGKGAGKIVSDSVSFTDLVANQYSVSLSDDQSISESLALVFTVKRALSDSLLIEEAVDHVWTDIKLLSDAIFFTDSSQETVTYIRLVDSELINDEVERAGFGKNVSDEIEFTESFEVKTSPFLTDTISFAEGLVYSIQLNLVESFVIADSLENQNAATISDSLVISEALSSAWVVYLEEADSQDFDESLILTTVLSLEDTVSFDDSITGVNAYLELSDSLLLVDLFSAGFSTVFVDSLDISEDLYPYLFFQYPLNDDLVISESLFISSQSLSDSLLIEEGIITLASFVFPISDSVSFDESLEKSFSVVLSDAIDFSDSLKIGWILNISDSLDIAEAIAFTASEAFFDYFSLLESVILDTQKVFSDYQIIEANLTGFLYNQYLLETEELSDSAVISLGAKLLLTDSLDLVDFEVFTTGLGLTDTGDLFDEIKFEVFSVLSEELAIAEEVGNGITLSVSDSVNFSEDEVEQTNPKLTDDLLIVESLVLSFVKGFEDSQDVLEGMKIGMVIEKEDAVSILEELSNVGSLNVSDSITFTESLETVNQFYLEFSDSQSISDSLFNTFEKSVEDNVTFAENIAGLQVLYLEDSLAFLDSSVKYASLVFSDTQSIVDSSDRLVSIPLSDGVEMIEALVSFNTILVDLEDSVTFSEGLVFEVLVSKADTLSISEELGNYLSVVLEDNQEIAESLDVWKILTLADNIVFTESLVFRNSKIISDALVLEEQESITFSMVLSDSLEIADSTFVPMSVLNLVDSLEFVESKIKTLNLSKEDSLEISETEQKLNEFYLSLSEGLSITESTRGTDYINDLSDSQSFSEGEVLKVVKGLSEIERISYEMVHSYLTVERIAPLTFVRTEDVNESRMSFINQLYT